MIPRIFTIGAKSFAAASAALVADGIGDLHWRGECDLVTGHWRRDQVTRRKNNCSVGAENIIVRTIKPPSEKMNQGDGGVIPYA